MSDIIIRLAGQPKGKAAMSSRNGIRFLPTNTRNYMAALQLASQQVMGTREPLAGALEVLVHASFQIPASWSKRKQADAMIGMIPPTSKPDLDNIMKMLDACKGVVFRDDSQIVKLEGVKVYGNAPETVVRFREWGRIDGLR